MPDGTSLRPVLSLRWDGQKLTGRTRFRSGTTTPIDGARVDGDRVTFQVMRTSYGRTAVTRYSGVMEAGGIRGSMESDWSGRTESHPWEAVRLPDTPEGTWKWTREFGERKLDVVLKARLDGDKVTGRVQLRRATADVAHGRYKEGAFRFELEGKVGGESFTSRFEGRLVGDQIRGKERLKIGRQEQVLDWDAERAD